MPTTRPPTKPAAHRTGEPAVLVLAPTGRDAALSCDMLRRFDVSCAICDSPASLIEQIRRGAGPAVIVAEALTADFAAELENVLAEQPKWSDLPLIVLAGQGAPPTHLRQLIARRNTTLLHRPLKVPTFVTTIRAAVQSRLRQYEVRDLLQQLEDRAHQLQRLALQLTQTEERERQRLAQVLHDDLQQVLAGAKFHVALLPKRARENHLEHAVTTLSDLLEQAIEKSRGLSHELSPPTLQQHGLVAALGWLAERKQQMHGLKVNVTASPDAEPADGRIRVFLYRCAQELLFNVVKHAGVNEAHLHLSADESHLILCVQDEGRGYAPGTQPDAESGGGLGLLSIRERANLLGGRFEVQAKEGEGSRFELIMPRHQDAAPAPLPEPVKPASEPAPPGDAAEAEAPPPRVRIVLADDHQVMRSGLRSLLEEESALEIVAEADDGAEAVDLAERLRPDLILMDVSMPRMDGIEATRRVKGRHPSIRVIGLSMFDDEETASKMRAAGAEHYLSKAGRGEHLLNAILGSEASPARGVEQDADKG